MFPLQRRNRIIKILYDKKSVDVASLVKEFNVSEETIRRDLKYLQTKKIVSRTYGVATILEDHQGLYVPSIQKRRLQQKNEKIAIAEEAIKLIKDVRFLLLDAGSTTENIAERIKNLNNYKDLSIITNGLNIAYQISKTDNNNIFLLGGKLRNSTLSIIGPQVIEDLKSYYIDMAIMGTTGISIYNGFSSSNIYEIEVKKAMISVAKNIIVVADHTKFSKHGLKTFCNFQDIDYLITSDLLEKSILEKLQYCYKDKLIIAQYK